MCLCTVYRGKSHCGLSASASADILALPKNPQWSSPIQQPCPNKLCTSRLFSLFLSASLPHSYPSSCFSLWLPPNSQPRPHNRAQSHLAIQISPIFFRLLRFKTPLDRTAPVLFRLHPDYLSPVHVRSHVCVCVSLFLNAILSIEKGEQRGWSPANAGATLIRLSKDIITEFQHYSV